MTKFYEQLYFAEFNSIREELKNSILSDARERNIDPEKQTNWFTDISVLLKNEKFKKFFYSLNYIFDLESYYVSVVFTLNGKEERGPHIDPLGNVETPNKIFLGLNIPLDESHTLMKWYQDQEVFNNHPSNLNAKFVKNINDVVEEDRALITGPTIIRADKIHSAENLSDDRRYLVSIRFKRCNLEGLKRWV